MDSILKREIKFRAWHKEQGKMYSAEELGQDQMTIMPDGRGFANISGISTSRSQIDCGRKMLPEQFTGLTDKNGKEIYEGDIVDNGHKHTPSKGVVEYWGNAFKVNCGIDSGMFNLSLTGAMCDGKVEVIGNIHQNPEVAESNR